MQKYEIKNYTHLVDIGKISNEAMQMHFKLYEGYVKNTNLLIEKFEQVKTFEADYQAKFLPEWTELHRRFGWEFNGMRLHELFFDGLTKEVGVGGAAALELRFTQDFGSFENWKKDFINICKMRGMGWTMLVQDRQTGKLINTWVNEHDAGMLADVNIILNVDMFEHAYIKDFGTDRQIYLDSIFMHLNWDAILQRLK